MNERRRSDGTTELHAICSHCRKPRWIPEGSERCARCERKVEKMFDVVTTIMLVLTILLFGMAVGGAVSLSASGNIFATAMCVVAAMLLFSSTALVWAVAKYLD